MSTGTKQAKSTETVEVDRDVLQEILEATKTARDHLSVSDLKVIAKAAADSKMFGMNEAQAFMLMSIAQAEGIPPVKALQKYHISERGKLIMKSESALADFQKRGGSVQWVTESDDREKCEAVFSHPKLCPDGKLVRFSMKDATVGGVSGNPTWKNWAPAMLRARVSTIGVRMIDPAILAGMCTEEEAQDIPLEEAPDTHLAKNFNNDTGHGSGAYAEPRVVQEYQDWIKAQCEKTNLLWLDFLTNKASGEIRSGPAEIIDTWKLSGHILKWSKASGMVKAPDDVRAGGRDKYAAIAWERARPEVEEEALLYCRKQWVDAKKALKGVNPTPHGRDPGDDDGADADEIMDQLEGQGGAE